MATNNGNTAQQRLTAQQRAALFAASTRQHFQMIGTESVSGGAQTVTFRVPKARILQGLRLLVEADVKVKHASGTAKALGKFDVYKMLRRVSVDLNNGFSPIVCGGYEIALMNTLYPHGEMVQASPNGDTLCKAPASLSASSSGTSNKIEFMLDLPLTLNYRDTNGLILAQNAETSIDCVIDLANAAEIVGNASGYTLEYTSVKISAMTTTFSVPARSDWFPDLSILKILDTRNETFTAGNAYVKLPTGMIYRKMVLCFYDADGNAMTDDDITSNIEIVMNTADIPYSISPKLLRATNLMQSGVKMPEGVYFWSFDWQGIIGYGGSRDYVDAERISELAIRFNAAKAGKLVVASEKLSRLIASSN